MMITRFNRRSYFHRPWSVHFSYAQKGGGCAPKGPWWRNINGLGIFLPHSQVWIEFRRVLKR